MAQSPEQELLNKSLTGTNPHFLNAATGEVTLNGFAIHALTDTTFTTLTSTAKGASILAGITLTAGQIVYLPISVIELATGEAVVYKHNS